MIPYQRCAPCRRMHSITTSLKAAILDHGKEFQPIPVRFSIPHTDTVGPPLLEYYPQHMFKESVRVRFLSQCVECVSERVQLATCQKFRRVQRFGRPLALDGNSRQMCDLFDDLLMMRAWAARFTPVNRERAQHTAI